jgi:hypothetical protein
LRVFASKDLSPTASCLEVQSYVAAVFSASSSSVLAELKMQALATALNVYFSDPSLGGNTPSALQRRLVITRSISHTSA